MGGAENTKQVQLYNAPMHRERGFTLVEVLAALVIVTFVITTSLYVFLERNKRLQQASEIILAYQALANESEYWRRDPYTSLEAQPQKFQSDLNVLAPLEPVDTVVAVKEIKTGLKSVTLTVRWRNGERVARLAILRVDTNGEPLW